MVNKEYVNYKNFGRCLKFTKNNIVLMVTVDLGPRIIYYGTENWNIMFEDVERKVTKDGVYFDNNFKCGEKWNIYGGHRFWKSPEDLATYVPDNYKVIVEETLNGARFTTKIQKMTKLKPTLEIEFLENYSIKITHTFENFGKTQNISLWGLTVMKKGGVEVIPQNTMDNGFLPNRNLVFWSYTDIADDRLKISDKYIVLKQNVNACTNLKIGLNSKKCQAGYFIDNFLFLKSFENKLGNYPDFGCNFETYTSNEILEMETLSPIYELKCKDLKSHTEYWHLFENINLGDMSENYFDTIFNKGEIK